MAIKAPVLNRKIQGTKRYCWRVCPYSTEDVSGRIPIGERTVHTTTSGKMRLDIRQGYDGAGWVCDDDACSYYLGTATTELEIPGSHKLTIDETGEYFYTHTTVTQYVCSGTRFWEK